MKHHKITHEDLINRYTSPIASCSWESKSLDHILEIHHDGHRSLYRVKTVVGTEETQNLAHAIRVYNAG